MASAATQARLGMARSQQDATNAYRNTESANSAKRLSIEQGTADAEAAQRADAKKRQGVADLFKSDQQKFESTEMELSPDPVKRLGQLQKRYDIERGKGYDTKSTEAQMNKAATEIEQAQRAKEQAKRDANTAAHDRALESSANRRIDLHVNTGGARPETQHERFMEDMDTKRFNAEFPGGEKPNPAKAKADTDYDNQLATARGVVANMKSQGTAPADIRLALDASGKLSARVKKTIDAELGK